MQALNSFRKNVLNVTKASFDDLALRVFHYQAQNNQVYQKYLQLINKNYTQIQSVEDIPFLPIEFFKTHSVITGNWKSKTTFKSSGTTGQVRSHHYIDDTSFYHVLSSHIFEKTYENIERSVFLALLPSYLEQGNSSLVSMLDNFISKSGFKQSGFYLNNYEELINNIRQLKTNKAPIFLFGVTYALLDIAENYNVDFSGVTVIETGGMKGNRTELLKEEVHDILRKKLNLNEIHSEYGMTELLSQSYSKANGVFEVSDSMRVLVRDINDPFSYLKNGKSGGINVIDLANIHSCAFIETQDIGIKYDANNFKILGRFDNSDVRGCNLLVN